MKQQSNKTPGCDYGPAKHRTAESPARADGVRPPPGGALESEIVLYRGGAGVRRGWTLVAASLLLTMAMFVLLPFADIIAARPQQRLEVRSVDIVRTQIKPPQLPEFRPPRPLPQEPKPVAERPKPKLAMPQKPKQRRTDVALQLNVPVGEFTGDFVVDTGSQLGSGFAPVTVSRIAADFDVDFRVDFSIEPELDEDSVTEETTTDKVFSLAQLDSAPKSTLQIQPVYPYRARARNTEGYVEVMFTVTAEGRTKDLVVVESEPGDAFVASVHRAVSRWRFEPGMKDGNAVAVRMSVKLRFELE